MKKVFTLLLTAALLLSILAVPAGASADVDSPPPYNDIGHLSEETQAAIEWLYYMNMMLGTGEGKFSPNNLFTRSMFVTMMARLENSYYNEPDMRIDEDSYDGPTGFSDVPQGRWDAPYVKWAAENGIVNGVGNGRFNPTGNITTEQFAAIVGRYLNHLGLTLSWSADGYEGWYPEIYDLFDVSEYANDYVIDLLGAGILLCEAGDSSAYVHPKHQLTRAEIAVMFADLYQLICTQFDYGISKDMPWGTVETVIH